MRFLIAAAAYLASSTVISMSTCAIIVLDGERAITCVYLVIVPVSLVMCSSAAHPLRLESLLCVLQRHTHCASSPCYVSFSDTPTAPRVLVMCPSAAHPLRLESLLCVLQRHTHCASSPCYVSFSGTPTAPRVASSRLESQGTTSLAPTSSLD